MSCRASCLGQDESRDDPTPFPCEQVVSASGGGVVHHLDADTLAQKAGHEGRFRKDLTLARAQDDEFRLQRQDGFDMAGVECVGSIHRPALDCPVRCKQEAAVERAVDQRDVACTDATNEQITFGTIERQVHRRAYRGNAIFGSSALRRNSTTTCPIWWIFCACVPSVSTSTCACRSSLSPPDSFTLTSSWMSSAWFNSLTTASVAPLLPSRTTGLRSWARLRR